MENTSVEVIAKLEMQDQYSVHLLYDYNAPIGFQFVVCDSLNEKKFYRQKEALEYFEECVINNISRYRVWSE